MDKRPLYWEATFEIVQALREMHPNLDVNFVGLAQLQTLILNLSNFVDDPLLVNDKILTDILREWFEEIES